MSLPEDLKKSLQHRLEQNNLLSAPALVEILKGLDADTPLNWNLILNREITRNNDDETQD